jgi:site-specific DNA-methyltransferase (adenine-specific)
MIRLINADCLEAMRDIPDGSVDMVLTDPPYGTTACKWDSVIPFEPMWEQLKRITKPNGAIVLTASQPFTSALIMSNVKMFKYEWIWGKERPTNPMLCKKQPPKYHENVCVFCKTQPTFNPTMVRRDPKNKRTNKPRTYADATKSDTQKYADRVLSGNNDLIYASNILKIPMQRGLHPTQKPVALMEYMIRTYTNAGDTVLDFTFGSGTTGVAAKTLGRSFIGIELDPDYFALGSKRIADTPECAA